MNETIMFKYNNKYAWHSAIQAYRAQWGGNPQNNFFDDLYDEYGIVPVITECSFVGMEIVDQDKFMLFRLRYL